MALPNLEFVSWEEFHKMCYKLAQEIEASGENLDTIVSISRGGHVVSRILSDLLGLPIFNVSIQSYVTIEQQSELKLTQKLGQYLEGKNVLLVDEVIDTGKTLVRALGYLKRIRAAKVISVATHVKPHTVLKPDFFAVETSKWIVYPYELRESIAALVPMWKDAGWNKDRMVRVLVAGGFEREMVKKYLE